MRLNFYYTKGYEVRYIGHLDLMRVFERALRRTMLPLKYTEGFNPRIKLSFALPLPVSVEGEAELATLELTHFVDVRGFEDQLNSVLPTGIKVFAAKIDHLKQSLNELVKSASYIVDFAEAPDTDYLNQVLGRDSLVYSKKSKHTTRDIDLKPYLYACRLESDKLFFTVKAGSDINIRPDEVLRILQPAKRPLRVIRQSVQLK